MEGEERRALPKRRDKKRGGTTTGRFVGCVDITMTGGGGVAMCELDGELGGRA